MSMLKSLASLTLALLSIVPPADAQHRREQDAAREAYRSGQVKSLQEIEAKILPMMRGAEYLGPEYDASSGVYRLKFMRGGAVSWVDVDGHNGGVIRRSGN